MGMRKSFHPLDKSNKIQLQNRILSKYELFVFSEGDGIYLNSCFRTFYLSVRIKVFQIVVILKYPIRFQSPLIKTKSLNLFPLPSWGLFANKPVDKRCVKWIDEEKRWQQKRSLEGEVSLLGPVCHEWPCCTYESKSLYLRRLILKEALLGQSIHKRVPNLGEISLFSHSN